MKHLLLAGVLVLGTSHLAFGAVDWELEVTDVTGDTAIVNSSGTLVLTGSAGGFAFANATTGVYTFLGSVGGYLVNVTTGEGSPLLSLGSLDLNSVDTAPGASGPLNIEWSENGLTTPGSSWTMAFGGTLISGSGSSISNTAYESNTNGFFATTNQIGTIVPTFTGTSFSGTSGGSVSGVTAPYSLTEVVTLDGVGATTYSGDASLTPAPEPASLILFASVLAAVIVLRRKFMKKAQVG